MSQPRQTPVLLAILDGWGIGEPADSNAVYTAATPTMDHLLANYPNTTLRCSGEDVGLPDGQMGNSEVGHLNIGAGYVVHQTISRINVAIRDGSFRQNPALRGAFERARDHGGRVHFMGLVSNGGVHSHESHLEALIDMAGDWPDVPVRIHAFTDGRDTSPTSGLQHITWLHHLVDDSPVRDIAIASVSGRYFAMDRDHRWDRTRQAFEVVTGVGGPCANDAVDVVRASYEAGITDEFVEPVRIGAWGSDDKTLHDSDEGIFFNFRADRARQLTGALIEADFTGFDRDDTAGVPLSMTTLTSYDDAFNVHVAFPPHDVAWPVARVISDAGLRQFHTAETEKYAHVTFFLNGGREEPFDGEERKLIPSPKVATYDLQPEMSAPAVCDAVLNAIRGGEYAFIIVNFANPDMVGHTGDIDATRKAVETVDTCLRQILEALHDAAGVALVTADHGNAEELRVPGTDQPMTAHTTNPVPAILVAPDTTPLRDARLRSGARLSAIGTTIIDLLNLPPCPDMTEPSLLTE